ncbi:MAG: DUF4412 domain-containing protein [Bacteroidales bacterium]
MQVFKRAVSKLIPLIIILLVYQKISAQNFEGEILFSKETPEDTTIYNYLIKGNKIRIEELNHNYQLVNYMIVDVSERSIVALNPGRKLYADIPVHYWRADKDTSDFTILKTGNYQFIKGYKCFQWRVQNKKENTEVAYWVANEPVNIFPEFLKTINLSEKTSIYFLMVPETDGYFPMLSVERSFLRELRMQLTVIKFQKKSLPVSLFEIPEGFRMFQKN